MAIFHHTVGNVAATTTLETTSSHVLSMDGTGLHSRQDAPYDYNLADIIISGSYVDKTGVVNAYDYFVALIDKIKNSTGARAFVPPGQYLIDLGSTRKPLLFADDYEGGFHRGASFHGSNLNGFSSYGTTLDFRVSPPTTNDASFVSRGTSGAKRLLRINWGTGTALTESLHLGRMVRLIGGRNAGFWMVTQISGSHISLQSSYFNNDGSPGDDTIYDDSSYGSTLQGYVMMPAVEVRARSIDFGGFNITTSGGGRFGAILEYGNPRNVGHSPTTKQVLRNCRFSPSAGTFNACMPWYNMWIGIPYVPNYIETTFTADAGTNQLTLTTTANDFDPLTGHIVDFSSTGTLPSPLASGTKLYMRRVSPRVITVHPTLADANNNTNITDITTTGSGTHTIRVYQTYAAFDANDGTSSSVLSLVESTGNGNVSEGLIDNVTFSGAWWGNVLHGSPSGQSVQWQVRNCIWTYTCANWIQSLRFSGNGQACFDNNQISTGGRDFAITMYGANRSTRVHRFYNETWGPLWYSSGTGNTGQGHTIDECHWVTTSPSLQGALTYLGTQGPIVIQNSTLGEYSSANSTDAKWSIGYIGGGTTNEPVKVICAGNQLKQSVVNGGLVHAVGNRTCGLWKFTGSEQFDIEERRSDAFVALDSHLVPTKVFVFSGSTYNDVTTAATNATTGDVLISGSIGNILYICFNKRLNGCVFDRTGGVQGTGGSGVWEFSSSAGTWGTLTTDNDDVGSFTSSLGNNQIVHWPFPSHNDTSTAWATGSVNGTSGYWVRFRVTGSYGTQPVISQLYGYHPMTFTFTETDIANAVSNTTKYMPGTGSVTPIYNSCAGAVATLPLFGSGSNRLNELSLWHICQVINYQANLYERNIGAFCTEDQTKITIVSMRESRGDLGDYGGGTNRMRAWGFVRPGKIDLSMAQYLNVTTGSTNSGFDAHPAEVDSNGFLFVQNVGSKATEVDSEVSFYGNHSDNIAFTNQALDSYVGNRYGTGTGHGSSTSMQRRRYRLKVTSTGRITVYEFDNQTGNLIGGATLPVGPTHPSHSFLWPLPRNARYERCIVNVTTAFVDASTGQFTLDLGVSGVAQDTIASDIPISTVGEKTPVTYTGIIGGKLNGGNSATLTCNVVGNVNLNTMTAGELWVEIYYRILA